MPYLFPNSAHVMLYTIRRYPFVVDGFKEEAGIRGVRESESQLTNGFFKLLGYEDLYRTFKDYATLGWEEDRPCGATQRTPYQSTPPSSRLEDLEAS